MKMERIPCSVLCSFYRAIYNNGLLNVTGTGWFVLPVTLFIFSAGSDGNDNVRFWWLFDFLPLLSENHRGVSIFYRCDASHYSMVTYLSEGLGGSQPMIMHPILQVPELGPDSQEATESRHCNRIIPRVVHQSADYHSSIAWKWPNPHCGMRRVYYFGTYVIT